jgi:hypothetical protein
VTITVANHADTPARNLAVTLPLPAGATSLAGAPLQWQQAQLDGQAQATWTTTLRLTTLPPGGALPLQPQATADGLPRPAQITTGVLVADPAAGAAEVRFTPGADALLRTPDGQIEIAVPAGAAAQALILQYSRQAPAPKRPPLGPAGFHQGFGTFYLTATDAAGQAIQQFARPLTIRLHYTPQQLQALSLTAEDLTLFRFDEQAATPGRWVPLPTTVADRDGTVTASIEQAGPFQLSDGSSPSEAFIPSLQGWQVGLFSGNASYSYPLDVPAGPAGSKPQVQLSYSSSATDGKSGLRGLQPAGSARAGAWTPAISP